ncbi:hypothetical protein JCM10296v2_004655 [Rhodotorula toruloides]
MFRHLSTSVEAHNELVFSFDFEANFAQLGEGDCIPVEGVPLKGRWQYCIFHDEDTEDVTFQLSYGDLPVGALGARTDWKASLYWKGPDGLYPLSASDYSLKVGPVPALEYDDRQVDDCFFLAVPQDTLRRAMRNNKAHNPSEKLLYRAVLHLKQSEEETNDAGEVLLQRLPTQELEPFTHALRLAFPRQGASAELWSRTDFLARGSPYFATLLSSSFAETHPPQERERDELQSPYKEIKITQTAFTTYRAVLAYLRTGYIAFAPLTSSLRQSECAPEDAVAARRAVIASAVSSQPELPYPASPKSVYRLAHLLELEELQEKCLGHLRTSLTPACVPYELFDEVAVLYPPWRAIVTVFATENWHEVKKTSAWAEVAWQVAAGSLSGSAAIMLDLMEERDNQAFKLACRVKRFVQSTNLRMPQ